MADTSNQIYLIGSHPDNFIQKLIAEGYKVTSVDSYANIKANVELITAILTIGHDDDLADPAELKKLLDAGVVLMVFSPSPQLLKGLHEASATIVDIGDIEIPNGVPLIIHRVPEDDIICITVLSDNSDQTSHHNSGSDSKANSHKDVASTDISKPDQGASIDVGILPAYSLVTEQVTTETPHDLFVLSLRRAIERISEVTSAVAELHNLDNAISQTAQGLLSGIAGISMNDNLKPTFLTKAYKRSAQFTLSYTRWPTANGVPIPQNQKFILESTVTFHCFAVNADPTKPAEFEKKGGVVYVIAVHGGRVVRDTRAGNARYADMPDFGWFVDSVQYGGEFTSPIVTPVGTYPDGETSILDHLHQYSASYEKNVMLMSNGHLTSHRLSIVDNFSLQDFKQTTTGSGGTYLFSVDYNKGYDAKAYGFTPDWAETAATGARKNWPLPEDNIPLHGIFVGITKLGKAKFVMKLNARYMFYKSFNDIFTYNYHVWRDATSWINSITLDISF